MTTLTNPWQGQADALGKAVFSAMSAPILIDGAPARGILSRESVLSGDYATVTETLRWKLCVLRPEVPALPRNAIISNPQTQQTFRVAEAADSDTQELAVWLREISTE